MSNAKPIRFHVLGKSFTGNQKFQVNMYLNHLKIGGFS